jgi:hypothetical protein
MANFYKNLLATEESRTRSGYGQESLVIKRKIREAVKAISIKKKFLIGAVVLLVSFVGVSFIKKLKGLHYSRRMR